MTNHIKDQYTGSAASGYESKRQAETKWRREQEVVRNILEQIRTSFVHDPPALLDVPVGTGRFFTIYKEFGFKPTGVDISGDMLAEAADKAQTVGLEAELLRGSIERLAFEDNSFDNVLCIRILNWVDIDSLSRIVTELSRVADRNIIVGIRVAERDERGVFGFMSGSLTFWGMAGYRAVKARVKPGRLKIHRESKVLRIFREHNLAVRARVLVEHSPRHSSYYVYHLTHQISR